MSNRRVGAGVAIAILATSLTACGSTSRPDGDVRPPVVDPLAAAKAQLAVLRRPRTPEDRWPAFANDNRPDDAIVVDRGAGRRLFTAGTARYGLWLVPAQLVAEAAASGARSMTDVCLRVIPLVGPGRGTGASSCAKSRLFGRDGTLLVIMRPDRDRGGSGARQPVVVAGTVPDGVRAVHLRLRRGGTLTQAVRNNVFLFETTRPAKQLRYRGPRGPVERPIRT